jgi:hypothetical protein
MVMQLPKTRLQELCEALDSLFDAVLTAEVDTQDL